MHATRSLVKANTSHINGLDRLVDGLLGEQQTHQVGPRTSTDRVQHIDSRHLSREWTREQRASLCVLGGIRLYNMVEELRCHSDTIGSINSFRRSPSGR